MLAIVPFKGPDGAKTRLARVLSAQERAELATQLLERVLAACRGAACIDETLLVTPNPTYAPAGVDVLVDAGAGHAEAIELGFADPRVNAGALVVMADCALVDAEALDALVRAADPVALAPARDGGVNAVAIQAAAAFLPRFNVSLEEMIAAARAAGLEPVIVDDERLSIDVDRPEDLALV